jgi:flagellar protein FlaG
MGLSLSSTHLIFFIAAVSVAGLVSGIFVTVINDVTGSFVDSGDRLVGELDTDFEIINDPDNIPDVGGYYIFYLKNIGESKLVTDNTTFQILIDGDLIAIANYNLTPSYIFPTEVAQINLLNSTIGAGTYQLQVVGDYAITDKFTFTID